MDFHRDGKDGFENPSDLLYIWDTFCNKENPTGFSLEMIQVKAQKQYDFELGCLLESTKGFYKRINGERGIRIRKPKIWNPTEDSYCHITLRLARIKRVAPDSKGTFTFTGSLVSRYGRYLRMDALMSVYAIADKEKTGIKLNAYCLEYSLHPGTCRKWAKDLLPLLGVDYVPGMDIWGEIRTRLNVDPDSSSLRQFFEQNCFKAVKGMFAASR